MLPWLAAAGILVAAPLIFTSGTALTMMSLMGIMVVFSLSYNMLLGQTGSCPSATRSITAWAPSSPSTR